MLGTSIWDFAEYQKKIFFSKVYKWNVSYWCYVDIYFHYEVYVVISVFLEVRKTADIF